MEKGRPSLYYGQIKRYLPPLFATLAAMAAVCENFNLPHFRSTAQGGEGHGPSGPMVNTPMGWTEGASRTHGERGARAYNDGLGAKPQRGPRAETLVRGSEGDPPEAESILPLDHPNEGQKLPL